MYSILQQNVPPPAAVSSISGVHILLQDAVRISCDEVFTVYKVNKPRLSIYSANKAFRNSVYWFHCYYPPLIKYWVLLFHIGDAVSCLYATLATHLTTIFHLNDADSNIEWLWTSIGKWISVNQTSVPNQALFVDFYSSLSKEFNQTYKSKLIHRAITFVYPIFDQKIPRNTPLHISKILATRENHSRIQFFKISFYIV